MRFIIELVYVWWVLMAAFWLSLALIAVPWQLTQGQDFETTGMQKKLIRSAIIVTMQLPVLWLTVMWTGRYGFISFWFMFAGLVTCGGIVYWIQSWDIEGPEHWDELDWVAGVQPILMFAIGNQIALAAIGPGG